MNGTDLLSGSLVGVGVLPPRVETEQKPPLEKKTSESALKVLDDRPVKAEVLELRGQLTELTPDGQNSFEAAILKQIKMIAGLQVAFAFSNQRYQMESGRLSDSQNREKYCLLGEIQKFELSEVLLSYEAFKTVFDERIKTLQATINNHVIEMAILRETMTGHESGWELGAFKRAISCFGAPYRLGEIKAALKERQSKLGIKVGDNAPDVELPKPPAADSFARKLINLTNDMACLKEEAAVIYEALRANAYEEARKSDWPKNFYTHLLRSLKEHKDTTETLKSDVGLRLEAIEKDLTDTSPLEPAMILSRKQERAEITKRWESILAHDKETTYILGLFKKLFQLEDQDEEVEFEDFSSVYTEAFNLLALIIFHREQVILGNAWESFSEIEIRKAVYLKVDVEQYKSLEAQKKQFDTEKVAVRVQQLMGAIQTYQGHIQTIEHGLQYMQDHLRILDREVQVRGKWPKETPPVSPNMEPSGVKVEQIEQPEQQDTDE